MALLHRNVFKGDFLSIMGYKFIWTIYDTMLDLDDCFLYIMRDWDPKLYYKPVGFIVGCRDSKTLFKRMLKINAGHIIKDTALALIRKPKLVLDCIKILRYESQSKIKPELLSICINPEYRNKKWGRKLVRKLERWFRKHKVKSYKVVVNQSNTDAQRFYHKLGFEYIKTFKLNDKEMELWKKCL